jgi:hypothetical protein
LRCAAAIKIPESKLRGDRSTFYAQSLEKSGSHVKATGRLLQFGRPALHSAHEIAAPFSPGHLGPAFGRVQPGAVRRRCDRFRFGQRGRQSHPPTGQGQNNANSFGKIDPTAAFKTTEVLFVAGKVKEITRPKRLFESFTGTRQLDWRKLKINSDRALAIALREPLLKNLHLRATQFWLERTPIGATWKIRFWASRQGKPDQTVEIGDLFLSAKTAEIIKTNLHTQKAD